MAHTFFVDTVIRPAVQQAMDICPIETAMAVLGGAWKLSAVQHLGYTTHRFGELQRALRPVTPRTLTRVLRELEADGVVSRKVFAQVPPRVEYSLTARGRSLAPILTALEEWGTQFTQPT